jgi:hypothetical protein
MAVKQTVRPPPKNAPKPTPTKDMSAPKSALLEGKQTEKVGLPTPKTAQK